MFFTKSFGYALRGILYIALLQDEQRKIQIDEISDKLSVPRHFLGKIMQNVVKSGLLNSTKGPYGGFSLNETTLSTPLIKLVETTDGMEQFNACVLQLRTCSGENPCPLHPEIDKTKTKLHEILSQTTIADLLIDDKILFIKSLATH
jgi:Rrf2 family protein